MSITASKTYDDYLKKQREEANKAAAEEIAKGQKEDAALKEKTHGILDQAATSAAAVYEQDIAQAPLDSRALYDENAMAEAVNRKKIAESLANMGMTDSGVSSSMNTALTIQKSNADNAVRAEEKRRIRAAESAIDQIWADTAAKKAEQDLAIDAAAADRERNLRLNAEEQAVANATALYNQDLKAQTDAYAAKLEADQAAAKAAQDIVNKRAAMAQSYIKEGYKNNEAWAQAYAAYPDSSTEEGIKYAEYKVLRESGWGSDYANAMSSAYGAAVAVGATEGDVADAMLAAVQSVAIGEINKAGLTGDLQGLSLSALSLDDAIKTASQLKAALAHKATQNSVRLSDTAQAYIIGSLYATIVTDANASTVGQALEREFGGNALSVALYYARLEQGGS